MLFSKQALHCIVCGKPHLVKVSFTKYSMCCSKECFSELEWRETLSIMGKEYYKKEEDK